MLTLVDKDLPRPWSKGLLVGQKKLQPKHVWSVRVRLEISRKRRDLAHLALVDHSLLPMARRSLAAPNHVGPKPGFEVILYMIAAAKGVEVIDNRAKAVPCYDIGYTFVEKLQTISTKFRKQQGSGSDPVEIMRHYYDVYGLLKRREVQDFIGTEAYKAHKRKRFPKADNQDISKNEAFHLSDPKTRALYAKAYEDSSALYYASRPSFEDIVKAIAEKSGDL